MAAACADPLMRATDAAEGLVKQGLPFRDAHEQVAATVRDGSFVAPEPAPGPGYMAMRGIDVAAAVAAARERWL
jgi:hypothetical protein